MGWTAEQVAAHNARVAAGAKKRTRPFLPTEYETHRQAPSPNPERAAQADVARPAQREKENPGRYAVVITSFRVRLADDDALIGKYFVDALRYAGLLASDEVGGLDYKIRQEKVPHKADERTEIEIEPI